MSWSNKKEKLFLIRLAYETQFVNFLKSKDRDFFLNKKEQLKFFIILKIFSGFLQVISIKIIAILLLLTRTMTYQKKINLNIG